jgi:hypothetical protein
MKKTLALTIAATWLMPLVASAETKTLKSLIFLIIEYLNYALVLMMGLALVMFVWFVIQYFIKPDGDRKEAGMYVMYSVIGFFVILSVWGMVNILQNTFGLQNQAPTWNTINRLFPTGNGSSNGSNGANDSIFDPQTGQYPGGN